MIQGALFLPESKWKPWVGPLPRLRGMRVAVDIETRDTGLAREMGPGWAYGLGYIAGVSAAWKGGSLYVPVRHPDSDNRPLGEVVEWLIEVFRECEVIFHQAPYDAAWLAEAGVPWPENFHDTYAASVMLDENQLNYGLDPCCARAGVPGKDKRLLLETLAAHGVKPSDFGASLWALPAKYVGEYAEGDAVSTLQLWEAVAPRLENERVWNAYRTEIDLMEVVYRMRKRGIRVNLENAGRAQEAIRADRTAKLAEITRRSGRRVAMSDLLSPDSLGLIFDAMEIPYPRTAKTDKPSFRKDWLEAQDHWLPNMVRECRKINDLAEKFLGTYIMGFEHLGRIHAEIHQLRDDDGGTRSFRFSYANPPLQQMPARDALLAEVARSVFMPEEGEVWAALDYSQQEYRMAVEFAVRCRIHGADAAAELYLRDVRTDFHQMIADMAGIKRSAAKIINLAMLYGMGIKKLARSLGLSVEDAEAMMVTYHRNNPWIRGLTSECDRLANERGWIRLIDGARCHFDRWEPARLLRGEKKEKISSRTLEEAREEWPGRPLRRSGTHKAMNRLSQGSSARQTKRAMLACARAGILPMIQMHDELGFSVANEQSAEIAAEIMRTAVPTKIPFLVDVEYGRDWGHAKHTSIREALAA